MHSNISYPDLKDFIITDSFMKDGVFHLHMEVERKPHHCPSCNTLTNQINVNGLKKSNKRIIFERKQFYSIANFVMFAFVNDLMRIKQRLYQFYELVNDSGIKEFQKAIETFKNWQKEILSSFAFDLHNGYIEGINNQTKVIKRNAFGFR